MLQLLSPAAVPIHDAVVIDAAACSIRHRISFWDALIVRAAALAGCEVVLSEDLSDGPLIDGVRIENPF